MHLLKNITKESTDPTLITDNNTDVISDLDL
ncbi:hypothetical protein BH10BAC3_BH10BAC3_18050 [soil metagenome]